MSYINSPTLLGGTVLNNNLWTLLMSQDLVPGAEPSYQICKTIFAYHPLGGKMVDSPLKMAWTKPRIITVQEAPEEVVEAFEREWLALHVEDHIKNAGRLARMYGISSVVLGCEGVPADQAIPLDQIWRLPIFFNELDPLNTAGSLVLSQIPNSPDFQKAIRVSTNGVTYHSSRFQVLMNENPLYIEYTQSGFGFVGRSVYQRALYPLKSFIRLMIADDVIATKLALLIAKMEQPGSILDNIMSKVVGQKRSLLQEAQTANVLSVGTEEDITTLNMQNVEGAGGFARGNILKNIATAADMPAFFLENETLAEGFGEGTEDAKNIVRYLGGIQTWQQPLVTWFDSIVQRRAWNPEFYAVIQQKYPDLYAEIVYEDAFSKWRHDFTPEWPSLIEEPESEKVEVDKTRGETIISALGTLLPELDPTNKAKLIEWAVNNLNENEKLLPHKLVIDTEGLAEFAEETDKAEKENAKEMAKNGGKGGEGGSPAGKMAQRMGTFRG